MNSLPYVNWEYLVSNLYAASCVWVSGVLFKNITCTRIGNFSNVVHFYTTECNPLPEFKLNLYSMIHNDSLLVDF